MKHTLYKFVVFPLLVLFFVVGVTTHAQTITQKSSLTVDPAVYDFGDIYPNNGPVSATVTLTNVGNKEIVVNRLSTSCGCTTATMDMLPLAPGETRTLTITFDPNVHPDESGKITRAVYLQTSDEVVPEIQIDIYGNVVRKEVIVFFNEACQDCAQLIQTTYPKLFSEYGYTVIPKDYINERSNRKFLNEYNTKWGIPFELQSHIEAFVDDRLMLGGHVPEEVIRYLLENPKEYDRLLVFQDAMHGEETEYSVWNFSGEIQTYPVDELITTYLKEQKKQNLGNEVVEKSRTVFLGLFGVITTSAFLDGLNPCAFAVLLFFISFLFSIKRTRHNIMKVGLVYIVGIFLAYFLIGVGLAQAIILSGSPHLMAYIGAYLVIGLGVIQLLGVFFPRFPLKLRIPVNVHATAERWLFKATVPAAFIGGFVVGLCTFPCSGGIYVAIVGMLSAKYTFAKGILWMLWYNVIFVSPLLILLLASSNQKVTGQLQKWERKESPNARILVGATMIALGIIMLVFFI